MCSKHRLAAPVAIAATVSAFSCADDVHRVVAADDELSDDAPMKPATDLPDKLRTLPVADEFTTERHRWNTNEVSGYGCVFRVYEKCRGG
jgi:hypothetical protein